MSTTGERPLVRPGFRTASFVVFVLLLPLVAHSIWDYVEARRLSARLDAIVRQGQPISGASNVPLPPSPKGVADADRFYRAAAALAGGSGLSDTQPFAYRMNAAMRSGDVPPELGDGLRARVEEYREALSFADRAAALPFERFGAGYTFNYLTSSLIAVSRLCEMRAFERALAGDGDGALASLYTDVRLGRVIELSVPYFRPPLLAGLKLALDRTTPSSAAREQLGTALAEMDHDDFLERDFVRQRALTIDSRGMTGMPWIPRPWMAHRLTYDLEVFAVLISAAEQPEPGRVNAVLSVGDWPVPAFFSERRKTMLEPYVKGLVASAERIRCARRLLAGEMVNCQP